MKWDEAGNDVSWLKLCVVGVLRSFENIKSMERGLRIKKIQKCPGGIKVLLGNSSFSIVVKEDPVPVESEWVSKWLGIGEVVSDSALDSHNDLLAQDCGSRNKALEATGSKEVAEAATFSLPNQNIVDKANFIKKRNELNEDSPGASVDSDSSSYEVSEEGQAVIFLKCIGETSEAVLDRMKGSNIVIDLGLNIYSCMKGLNSDVGPSKSFQDDSGVTALVPEEENRSVEASLEESFSSPGNSSSYIFETPFSQQGPNRLGHSQVGRTDMKRFLTKKVMSCRSSVKSHGMKTQKDKSLLS
ncbi:hypothetical protein Q3G72_035032 [Acer saccharum]|nr:hypothetical protein Q3G72_035032 [Acer saccharum]